MKRPSEQQHIPYSSRLEEMGGVEEEEEEEESGGEEGIIVECCSDVKHG